MCAYTETLLVCTEEQWTRRCHNQARRCHIIATQSRAAAVVKRTLLGLSCIQLSEFAKSLTPLRTPLRMPASGTHSQRTWYDRHIAVPRSHANQVHASASRASRTRVFPFPNTTKYSARGEMFSQHLQTSALFDAAMKAEDPSPCTAALAAKEERDGRRRRLSIGGFFMLSALTKASFSRVCTFGIFSFGCRCCLCCEGKKMGPPQLDGRWWRMLYLYVCFICCCIRSNIGCCCWCCGGYNGCCCRCCC